MLSEYGRHQAQRLNKHLESLSIGFDHVFSSDLSRAHETCQLIVGPAKEVVIDGRLRERAFGTIEGKSVEAFKEEAILAGHNERNYSSFTPPGAETLSQVNERVRNFCQNHLVNIITPGCNVLIVTHGGVIREFMRYFRDQLRCDLTEAEPLKVTPNTGVNVFRICYHAGKLRAAECLQIHETAHLEDMLDEQIIETAKENLVNDNLMAESVPLEAL